MVKCNIDDKFRAMFKYRWTHQQSSDNFTAICDVLLKFGVWNEFSALSQLVEVWERGHIDWVELDDFVSITERCHCEIAKRAASNIAARKTVL